MRHCLTIIIGQSDLFRMISLPLKSKTNAIIALMALTAPLFNLKVVGSVTLFDVVSLFSVLVYFSRSVESKTILLIFSFTLLALVSELYGLTTLALDGKGFLDSVNVLFRYLILLFIMPYLSYKLFYFESNHRPKIDLFYTMLMFSFFGVLIFNIYAIYFQLEDYFFLQRFCSIYGNANTAALVLNIMSVVYLFNTQHTNVIIRLTAYAAIPLTVISLIVTGSFSGYLIQFSILTIFLYKSANFKALTFIVVAGITLFSFEVDNIDSSGMVRGLDRFMGLSEFFTSDDTDFSEVGSAGERLISIKMALTELILNPRFIFLGVGFGNVEVLVNNRTGHTTSIHLAYLQLLISIGVIGMTMYLYIFLRIFTKIPRYLVGNDLVIQSNVLLLVFLLLGMFIPHTYMGFYFAPIFPLLGLYGVNLGHN